ncbi:MAG: protein kinase [Planctomycetaceae bacterium]|jgi:serine/threonine protein kinase|nr:protein kinase [Planctomycetaceae bacterium]
MLDSRYPNNAGDNDSGTLRAELTLEGVVERREGSSVDGGHPEGIFEGEFIPGYEFISELGRGGMGIVYKARDRKLKRLVAVKMIRSGSNAGKAERLRFQAEAEAVAQLHHNNIVDIYMKLANMTIGPISSLSLLTGGV